jgi:chitin disaccharide deacetylase
MEKGTKTLVVNADDFGLSQGINRGIRSAFNHGIVRSVSLMPNGPAFEDAVRMAARTPGLDVGIHLTLVNEQSIAPLAEVLGLADQQGLLPKSYLPFIARYILKRFRLNQIQTEIKAQIQKIQDAGISPTHLDSHQHLHVLPGVMDIVLEEALAAKISVIRLPWEKIAVGKREIKQRVLFWLCRKASAKILQAGLRYPDHFWGIGFSGRLNQVSLSQVIHQLDEGVNELMCHPGFGDPETQKRYPWRNQWDEETAALCSDTIKKLIIEKKVRLASFREAWESRNSGQ